MLSNPLSLIHNFRINKEIPRYLTSLDEITHTEIFFLQVSVFNQVSTFLSSAIMETDLKRHTLNEDTTLEKQYP